MPVAVARRDGDFAALLPDRQRERACGVQERIRDFQHTQRTGDFCTHALVRVEAAVRRREQTGRIFQHRGKIHVDAARPHAFDRDRFRQPARARRAARHRVGDHPDEVYRIATHVVERPAAELRPEFDRRRIREQETKRRVHLFDFTEHAAADHRQHRARPRRVAIHERLHQPHAVGRTRRDHLPTLGGVQRGGFLDEHMLAVLRRADRPLAVQRIRQRNIDRVHVRVAQQALVAVKRLRHAGKLRPCRRELRAVTRRQGVEFRVLRAQDRRDNFHARDARIAEDAPADFAVLPVHGFKKSSIDDSPATLRPHAFTAAGRKFRTAHTPAPAISATRSKNAMPTATRLPGATTHSQLPAPQRQREKDKISRRWAR